MKKLIVRGGLIVVVLVVVGLVAVYFSLNSIVKTQVEKQGTKATGVATVLESVNLNPFGGALSLNDFSLANPEGFSDGKIFKLGEGDVQVKLGSLLSDEVVVPKVNLDGAEVLLELNGLNLNTMELLKQIQEAGQSDDAGTEGDQPEPTADGDKKGFVVNELNITNTKVIGRLTLPGGVEQDINLTLADIKKTDVRGVEMGDVIAFALETILLNASQSVADAVPNLDALGDQLEGLSGQVLDNVGGELDKVAPGLGDAAKELGGKEVDKALGDLFGNKKDKEEETAE